LNIPTAFPDITSDTTTTETTTVTSSMTASTKSSQHSEHDSSVHADEVEDDVDDEVLAVSDDDDDIGVVFDVNQWAKIENAVVQNLNMSLKAIDPTADPTQWSQLSEDMEQTLTKQLGDAMGAATTFTTLSKQSSTDHQPSLDALGVQHNDNDGREDTERLDAGLSMLRKPPRAAVIAGPHTDHLNATMATSTEDKLNAGMNIVS